MATSNLTSVPVRVRLSPETTIYTAIVEGCFARFYASRGNRKRLVMVQRFPSNVDAVRESASYIERMG